MSRFATTRWSIILDARDGPEASRRSLELICRDYRRPVLAYIRHSPHASGDAEDLAQEFFARLVERRWDLDADPARGRFRALVLTALRRFLSDMHSARVAAKRGGGWQTLRLDADESVLAAPAQSSPEAVFDREWALTVLQRALDRLRDEAAAAGRAELFDHLSEFVVEPAENEDYRQLAEALGMRANTIAVSVHRLRGRLRVLARDELRQTVSSEQALDAELAHLRHALGGMPPEDGAPAAAPRPGLPLR